MKAVTKVFSLAADDLEFLADTAAVETVDKLHAHAACDFCHNIPYLLFHLGIMLRGGGGIGNRRRHPGRVFQPGIGLAVSNAEAAVGFQLLEVVVVYPLAVDLPAGIA